jgi:hypothetical protein
MDAKVGENYWRIEKWIRGNRVSMFRRFRNIAKATVCFMSVRPSVRTKHLGSRCTDFDEIWFLEFFFSKICPENSSFIKIRKE